MIINKKGESTAISQLIPLIIILAVLAIILIIAFSPGIRNALFHNSIFG